MPTSNHPPSVTLRAAIAAIAQENIEVVAVSQFYQTPCFPPGAGPDYVNAAAYLKSPTSPKDMLNKLHKIEASFGRERKQRWGMRTLDLDLIACGDLVMPDRDTYSHWHHLAPEAQHTAVPDDLILPHPRLQDRAFVLVPLRDIAAQWLHPVLKLTVTEMCTALSPEDLAEIRMLGA